MKFSSRAAVLAAFGVGPLLLAAGCGGTAESGTEATLARIQPTSFVEIAPATTTTTTTPAAGAPGDSVSQGEQTYTIKAGDTLGRIASRFGVTLDQLVAYNQFADGANQLILPGDPIKIPPGASIPGAAEPDVAADPDPGGETGDDGGDAPADTSATTTPSGDCPTTYVIKAGDNTRIGVAEQFGITFEQLDAANLGVTPNYENFVVGTEIIIPCP